MLCANQHHAFLDVEMGMPLKCNVAGIEDTC